MELSVIIPAYNEEQRITDTLFGLADYLQASGIRFELLVVDDGSSDGTVALVESLVADIPQLRCIATSPNRGKGHAVRVGMLEARGDVRLMSDADGSMPASEIPKLLRPLLAGEAEVAIGSRYVAGARSRIAQPAWRRAWSRLANRIIQRSMVAGVRDTQCGFKAFSARVATDVFSRARIDGWAFDLEVLALADRLGYRIAEIGVRWDDDERSRVSPLRDLLGVVREWLIIRSNLRRGVYGQLQIA